MASQTDNTNIINSIKARIGAVESKGWKNPYAAKGKKTSSGDYAYGKYQVMGANIPAWTKEALGKSMTIQQFQNSPDAQEKVADYRMGQIYNKYGNQDDVASVWFTGQPAAKAGNVKDANGTTNQQYVAAVASALPDIGKDIASAIPKISAPILNAYHNLFGVNQNLIYSRPGASNPAVVQSSSPQPKTPVSQSLSRAFTPNGIIGKITTPFGGQTSQEAVHPGVDIAAPNGTPVPSPVSGVVTSADYGHVKGENNFGNSAVVTDANGDSHRFSHMANGYVQVGQPVNQGQQLGTIGDTGATYSPSGGDSSNLDYRISTRYGQMKNPMLYLQNQA
jgi:murein DD-endopeptidase MepM/ murein hydrolase activator NlpD